MHQVDDDGLAEDAGGVGAGLLRPGGGGSADEEEEKVEEHVVGERFVVDWDFRGMLEWIRS